jgi:hypothetical protein
MPPFLIGNKVTVESPTPFYADYFAGLHVEEITEHYIRLDDGSQWDPDGSKGFPNSRYITPWTEKHEAHNKKRTAIKFIRDIRPMELEKMPLEKLERIVKEMT